MSAVLVNAALGSSVAQATPANFTLNFATSTGTPGVGDLIIVAVTIRGTAGTVATPSGWTAMTGSPFQYASNASRMYLFYRVRAAGDANSVSFTVSGGVTNNTLLAQAYYFGGVDPTTPIEVNPVKTDQASSSTTVAASSITTLNANALGVAFFHRADDAGTWAAANSWIANSATNARPASTLGSDASMGMATKEMPTAGATSAPTLTVTSGAAAVGQSVVLALKAQTGAGTITMDAEGGTDEVTPTAQSAATPTIAIVVGTALTVVDTAWKATHNGGTKSFRHDLRTTSEQGRVKSNVDIPATQQYGAFIMRCGARPTAATRIASLEAYNGTDYAQVQMNASGQLRLASDGAANSTAWSTTTVAANEEFRCEWQFNAGAVELRIFTGADLGDDVSTPTETLTASGWPSGNVGRGMFGNGTNWGVITSLWYDNCTVRRDNWVNLKSSLTAVGKNLTLLWNVEGPLVPEIVAHAANNSGTGSSNTWSVVLPTVLDDDVAYLQVTTNSVADQTNPAGWELIEFTTNPSSALQQKIYRKVLTAADSGTTVSQLMAASLKWTVTCVIVRNDGGIDIEGTVHNVNAGATTWPLNAITPVSNDTLLLGFHAWRTAVTGTTTQTPPTNWTERVETSLNASASPTNASAISYRAISGGAGVSVPQVTDGGYDQSSASRITLVIAIKPSVTLTAVGKDLIARYNVRSIVQDNTILRFNVRSVVQDNSVVRWDVRTKATKDTIARWSVRTVVQKNLTSLFNVRRVVQKNLTSLFNVRALVTKTPIFRWSVRSVVQDNSIFRWGVRTSVNTSRIFRFNVRAAVGKSLITRWDVLAPLTAVGKNLVAIWNVRSTVHDNSIVRWNVRAVVQDNSIVRWNVRSVVQKSLITRWSVRLLTGFKDLTARWSVRSAVGTTRVYLWNLRAQAGKSTIVRFNVRALATKNTIVRWNVRAMIAKTLIARWSVRTFVGISRTYLWNLRAQAGKSLITRWNVRALATKTNIFRWGVRTSLSKTLTTRWSVRSLTGFKDLTARWSVRNLSGFKDLTARWAVRSTVGTSRIYRWNVRSIAAKATTALWNVRAAVAKTLIARWSVRTLVFKSTIVRWNVRAVVAATRTYLWDVLSGLALTPVGKDLIAIWNVRATAGKSLISRWSVRTSAAKTLIVRWNVRRIAGTELLTSDESNFEGGIGAWISTAGANVSLTRSSDFAKSGQYSMKAERTGSSGDLDLMISPRIPVTPGKSYTFRASYLSDNSTNNTGILALWYNSGGGLISQSNGSLSAAAPNWKTSTLTATAPEGAASVRFDLYHASMPIGGRIYWDEVSMTQIPSLRGVWNVRQRVHVGAKYPTNIIPDFDQWRIVGGGSVDPITKELTLNGPGSYAEIKVPWDESANWYMSVEVLTETASATPPNGGLHFSSFYYGADGVTAAMNIAGWTSNGHAQDSGVLPGAWSARRQWAFGTGGGPGIKWIRIVVHATTQYTGTGYVKYRNPQLANVSQSVYIPLSLTARWNVRALVTVEDTFRWGVRALASTTDVLRWSVRALTTKTTITRWNVRALATKSTVYRWSVRRLTGFKDLTARWNVRTSLSKTLTSRWSVRSVVAKTNTLRWNVRTLVTQSRVYRWSIRTRVGQQLVARWNLRSVIGREWLFRWDVRGYTPVPRDTPTDAIGEQRYAVRDRFLLGRDLDAPRYNVRDTGYPGDVR